MTIAELISVLFFIFELFFAAFIVEGITEIVFSPLSFLQTKIIMPISKWQCTPSVLKKLLSCPYCFSFWVACIFSFIMWNGLFKCVTAMLISWRIANWLRLTYKKLLNDAVNGDSVITIEE